MYNIYHTTEMISVYFSNPIWLILFFIALLYLVFRISNMHKKVLLVVAFAFFLVINDFVFSLFISLDEGATYYRNLWVIPYMAVIGIAVIDVIYRIPKLAYRLLFVVVFCIGTAMIESINPFCYLWKTPMDRQMVSSDVLKMNQQLEEFQKKGEDSLFVAGPDEILIPLWLYNGKIKTVHSIYAPNEELIWKQLLSEEDLNIERIMEIGKEYGRNYVIVPKGKKTEKRFKKKGYKPVCVTDNYLMYAIIET